MDIATPDKQGRLQLPARIAREIGERPLQVMTHSESHLFCTAGGEDRILLTGVLGEVGIVDLISFLNMFRKSGLLRFDLEGGCKELFFHEGEVVAATSSFAEENLEEILHSLGFIDQAVLEKVRSYEGDPGSLWKMMVERRLVASKNLWQAMRHQAEQIVYHLMTFKAGAFTFVHRSLDKSEHLRLSMSTQNLLMEGLRRQDELQLFMTRIGSLAAIPVPTGKQRDSLGETEQRVLDFADGERDVSEVLRRSALGEFDGLRVLYTLVENGQLAMEKAPDADLEGELGEILGIMNEALILAYQSVAIQKPDFRQDVRNLLRDLPQPYSFVLRDASLRENGGLDGRRILENLSGLEEGDKKKLLADALSELLYMQCHAAREILGATRGAELNAAVQKISAKAKNIVGRNG